MAITHPSLVLDFAGSRQVDPRVVFSRASTATRFNKFGVLETVPANMPRINYAVDDVPILGPELVTNGVFDTDTAWTKGAGWTIASLAASRVDSAEISLLSQTISLVPGSLYAVTYKATIASGSITATFGGGTTVNGVSRLASGTYLEYMRPIAGNNQLRMSASVNFSGSIDNVSVKEVVGYSQKKGDCLGLLIEEARTNRCIRSQDFASTWSGYATATVVADKHCGVAFTKLEKTQGTSESKAIGCSSVLASQTDTLTLVLRAGSVDSVDVGLGLSGDTWGLESATTHKILSGTGVSSRVTGSLIRVTGLSQVESTVLQITRTYASAGTATVYIYPHSASSTTIGASILATMVQIEFGTFPTSYIPTSGVQATRAADYARIPTLLPWYNATEGTLCVEANWEGGAIEKQSNRIAVSLDDGTYQSRIIVYNSGGSGPGIYSSVNGNWNFQAQRGVTDDKFARGALAIKRNNVAYSAIGKPVDTFNVTEVPAVIAMGIGCQSQSGGNLGGHVKNITYFPTRLSDYELMKLSK